MCRCVCEREWCESKLEWCTGVPRALGPGGWPSPLHVHAAPSRASACLHGSSPRVHVPPGRRPAIRSPHRPPSPLAPPPNLCGAEWVFLQLLVQQLLHVMLNKLHHHEHARPGTDHNLGAAVPGASGRKETSNVQSDGRAWCVGRAVHQVAAHGAGECEGSQPAVSTTFPHARTRARAHARRRMHAREAPVPTPGPAGAARSNPPVMNPPL
jgi:hypothetical protein